MQATFTFELADWQALHRVARAHGAARYVLGRRNRINYYLGFFLFCGIVFCMFATSNWLLPNPFGVEGPNPFRFNLLSGAIGGFTYYISTLLIAKLTHKKRQRELFVLSRSADESVTNTMTSDGIEFREPSLCGSCPWDAITTIRTTNDYLFLFISPFEAFIFPRRAFGSDNAFESAIAFARTHANSAEPD